MRPKFVLTLTVLAALVLAGAFLVKQHSAPPPPETSLPVSAADPAPAAPSNSTVKPKPSPVAAPKTPPTPMTAEQRQASIEEELTRLQDLSTRNDPASLSAILNDLTHPEKEVRLAAIEATKQFGSRDAIPTLKAAVATAADTDEQIALLEAADFLSLPTIADNDVQVPLTPGQIQANQQHQAQEAALRQARSQQRAQNQNPQPAPDQNAPAAPNN